MVDLNIDEVREEANALRWEIAGHRRWLDNARSRLIQLESSCRHQWSEPSYNPIRVEGYHDPGDPEGTRGIDRRLPRYVPATETPRWERTCSVCGKHEETTHVDTKTVETKTPRW